MEPAREDSKAAAASRTARAGCAGDYLVFEVDRSRFALPVAHVREVLPALAVDPVPGETDELLGVITLRGRMVPVLDARRVLGAAPRDVKLRDHFLVREHGGHTLVLPCDRVVGIATLVPEDGAAAGLGRAGVPLTAVLRDETGLILVPDLSACALGAEST